MFHCTRTSPGYLILVGVYSNQDAGLDKHDRIGSGCRYAPFHLCRSLRLTRIFPFIQMHSQSSCMRLPVYTCAFTVTAIVKYVIYMLTWRVGERCSWEFVTSLDFDWSFMTGKRKFAWPMVGSKIRVMMDSHLMNPS